MSQGTEPSSDHPELAVDPLWMITMDPPQPGEIVNVDGDQYRVVRIASFTGYVARLEVERVG